MTHRTMEQWAAPWGQLSDDSPGDPIEGAPRDDPYEGGEYDGDDPDADPDLRPALEAWCPKCNGTGIVWSPLLSRNINCPRCGGVGK